METPTTLQQAIIFYSNPDNCIEFLMMQRWPDGVVKCPICGAEGAKYLPTRRVWQCKTRHPKSQFSIKVGTIFEDSALGLDKWLMAMWMLANCKNGISSHEIAKATFANVALMGQLGELVHEPLVIRMRPVKS
jgi:hypothetical protein